MVLLVLNIAACDRQNFAKSQGDHTMAESVCICPDSQQVTWERVLRNKMENWTSTAWKHEQWKMACIKHTGGPK